MPRSRSDVVPRGGNHRVVASGGSRTVSAAMMVRADRPARQSTSRGGEPRNGNPAAALVRQPGTTTRTTCRPAWRTSVVVRSTHAGRKPAAVRALSVPAADVRRVESPPRRRRHRPAHSRIVLGSPGPGEVASGIRSPSRRQNPIGRRCVASVSSPRRKRTGRGGGRGSTDAALRVVVVGGKQLQLKRFAE